MTTTDEVRACFVGQIVAQPDGTFYFGDTDELNREFDGWLLRVRAGAWDEGFIMGVDSASGDEILSNPYREETE